MWLLSSTVIVWFRSHHQCCSKFYWLFSVSIYCDVAMVTFDVLGVEKGLCMSVNGVSVMLLV